MAVSLIDSGSTTSTTFATSLAGPAMSGLTYADDDVALVVCAGFASSTTLPIWDIPSGYTEDLNWNYVGGGNDWEMSVVSKVLSGTETEPTFTPTNSSVINILTFILRGLDLSVHYDVAITTQNYVNDNPAPSDGTVLGPCPAITPTTDNGALILVAYAAGSGTSVMTAFTAPTTPAGLSKGPSVTPGNNYCNMISAYDMDYGSATTFTPSVWGVTTGGGGLSETGHITIAIRPASGVTDINYSGLNRGIMRGVARKIG